MPLVSSSIPNLINGVSQQPAALRLSSQAESVINCFPSPVEGLRKRPPSYNLGKLFSGSSGSGRPFVSIVDRDGTIRYMVYIRDGDIKVFDLNGAAQTVTTPDGVGYLDIANNSDPSAQFRVASVADATFIVNREKTVNMLDGVVKTNISDGSNNELLLADTTGISVGMKILGFGLQPNTVVTAISGNTVYFAPNAGGPTFAGYAYSFNVSPAWGTRSMVFLRSVDFNTTYKIKVNNSEATFTTQPGGGKQFAVVYDQIATNVTVTSAAHGLVAGDKIQITTSTGDAVPGKYTIASATANTFTYVAPAFVNTNGKGTVIHDPELSTVSIASALASSLQTSLGAGFQVIANQYVISIRKIDGADYTLEATDTRTGEGMIAIKDTIDSIAKLPTIGDNGFIVKVQGNAETNFDDFYLKFEKTSTANFGPGVWRECVAPGIKHKLDETTMPHVLVRNANGTFTFKKFDWSGRVAGDTLTAPEPSFVGAKIQNVNLFRNRLAFLADESVILSAADSYDRFWPETVQAVVDSDPIDISTGGTEINFLVSSLAFANTLLLFSRHGQFRLDTGVTTLGSPLTPKTATVTAITTFDMQANVDPVGVGRTVYFAIPKGEFSGLREFYLPDASGPVPLSEEVTAAIPRYIPKNVTTLAASVSEETVIAISKDQTDRIYFYKFFFEEETKLQSSWSFWQFQSGKQIIGADIVDSDLYVLCQYGDGVYMERIALRPETTDTGSAFELLLDRKASETACTVTVTQPAGVGLQSTITLPYPMTATGTMALVGRLVAGNTLQHGQAPQIVSETLAGGAGGNGTIVVLGDLSQAKFFVGELYQMTYEFSTPFIKEQPAGGGVAVAAGPKLQLRNWTVVFDKTAHFQLRITAEGRDAQTYTFEGYSVGSGVAPLGSPALKQGQFRAPVMTRNTGVKIELLSNSPLPCRVQSCEWEGWYHSRAARM